VIAAERLLQAHPYVSLILARPGDRAEGRMGQAGYLPLEKDR